MGRFRRLDKIAFWHMSRLYYLETRSSFMKNYWSCTQFADWLRGTPKSHAGTAQEWSAWEQKAKRKKIRFWLAEEGLDLLQTTIYFPLTIMQNLRHYMHNRYISKTHALTSKLKRGQWHEFDTRMLHALFDELVDFVEVELAWHHVVCSDEERLKHTTPWYRKNFPLGLWRKPEAGLAYLDWAAQLKHDEGWIDKNDPTFGQPTPQALAAQQTLKLYNWWKSERPKRPDPMDASGWSDHCEKRRLENKSNNATFWSTFETADSDNEHTTRILELCHKLEQEHDNEDTAMLHTLINIRHHLWT